MKEYSEELGLSDIWKYFEGYPLAHLATIEGDQPRVRPMALITFNEELWLATKTEWNKVDQIRNNNRIEFTLAPSDQNRTGSIRVTGIAIIVEDQVTKKSLSAVIPWFHHYWADEDDPNFTLLKVDFNRILYDHPTNGKKYTIVIS